MAVLSVQITDTAEKRVPVIVSLMDHNLRNKKQPMQGIMEKCRRTKFLQQWHDQKDFPLKWKGDELMDRLCRVSEGFLSNN